MNKTITNAVFEGQELPRLNIITAAELRSMEFPPIEMLIDGFLPEGLTFIAGPSKLGKSRLARQACIALASGEPS